MEKIDLEIIYSDDFDNMIDDIKMINKIKEHTELLLEMNELRKLELYIQENLVEKCVKLYKLGIKLGVWYPPYYYGMSFGYDKIEFLRDGIELMQYWHYRSIAVTPDGRIVYGNEDLGIKNELEKIESKIGLCNKFINDFKRFENEMCKEINYKIKI